MVVTIPDWILGVKIASSSDDEPPRLNLVEDKFSPTLGVNFKVRSISGADLYSAMKKKNQEYDHESPPHRIAYDEICRGVNPRKSVLSRASHIENTKKVFVGRLMRSGCKVHYLRRRQKILAAYNKRRLAPPPSVLMKKNHHCKGIALEKSCIEAKTKKSEGLNQEQTSSLAPCIEEVTKRTCDMLYFKTLL